MAGLLLREAAWATRILDEVRSSPEAQAEILVWLRDGGDAPPLVKRLAEPPESKPTTLPRGWRETAALWMTITPINHLTLVPTMAALIRPGLQSMAPAEWQRWFNAHSVPSEVAIDGHGLDHPSR